MPRRRPMVLVAGLLVAGMAGCIGTVYEDHGEHVELTLTHLALEDVDGDERNEIVVGIAGARAHMPGEEASPDEPEPPYRFSASILFELTRGHETQVSAWSEEVEPWDFEDKHGKGIAFWTTVDGEDLVHGKRYEVTTHVKIDGERAPLGGTKAVVYCEHGAQASC